MFDEIKSNSIIGLDQEGLNESIEVNHEIKAVTEAGEDAALDDTEIGEKEKLEPDLDNNSEVINTEKRSADAKTSSLLSTDSYSNLTEEELEIEFEQELLPSIEQGIYPEGCVEKIIRLGEFCEIDIIHIEAAYYLRYYYYMIAKYVLEQKYNASKAHEDLAALEAFEDKYESAKIEYQAVRDDSLPLELRLIENFVEAASPLMRLSYIRIFSEITLYIDPDENLPAGANLFFFPESDFYGVINSIKINTNKRPRALSDYNKGGKNKAEYVRIDDKHMRFFNFNYNSKTDLSILAASRDIIELEVS